jgi:ATP-dependent Clp protease ATP-binding subunit ClpX
LFCGKGKSQIGQLIAGPAKNGPQVFICDQCVALCGEIIQAGRKPGQ